jgi:hypothetical protein
VREAPSFKLRGLNVISYAAAWFLFLTEFLELASTLSAIQPAKQGVLPRIA